MKTLKQLWKLRLFRLAVALQILCIVSFIAQAGMTPLSVIQLGVMIWCIVISIILSIIFGPKVVMGFLLHTSNNDKK